MSYRFEADETLAEAFARSAGEQLQTAATALRRDVQTDPADAIHRARKAIKKERALLRLMRDAVERDERRWANETLRGAGRRLSGARDADVVLATLGELSDRYAGQVPQTAFAALRERLQAGYTRAQLPGPATGQDVAGQLAAIHERLLGRPLRRHGWAALDGGLASTYRRGAKAFAGARAQPSDENLHSLRKRVKDLWYQLRLLAPVAGGAVLGHAKDAHGLADLLGDDHDLAVLREALVGVGADVAADLDAVLGLLDYRRAELQRQAMSLGERVYAERPRAFRRRMRRSWQAGRGQRRAALKHGPAELAHATRPAHAA